jgi:hypothetical protein
MQDYLCSEPKIQFTIRNKYNFYIFWYRQLDPLDLFHYRVIPECIITLSFPNNNSIWKNFNEPKIIDWLFEEKLIQTNISSRLYKSNLKNYQSNYEKFYKLAIEFNHLDLAEYLLTKI